MSEKWDDAAQAEALARHEAEYNELLNSIPSADDRALETMSDLEFLWLSVAPNKTSDDFEAEIHEPFNTDDPDLDDMVEDYLKLNAIPDEWALEDGDTPSTVPGPVRSAVLLVIGTLYADREGATDPLTPAVESLLMRLRDPAVA